MKLVIIFDTYFRIMLLAVGIISAAASSEFTLRCLVTYLRGEKVQEELLSNIESVDDLTECENIISSFYSVFYNKFNSSPRFHACVKRRVDSSELKSTYISIVALRRLGLGLKMWKVPSRNERITELLKMLHDGMTVVLATCQDTVAKEEITAHFDKAVILEREIPDLKDSCVIAHLLQASVDQAIVDSNRYNSTHFNIPKENKECNVIVTKIQDDFYRDMEANTADCIIKFYRKEKLAEWYMTVDNMLPFLESKLSKKELSDVREKFVNDVFEIMHKAVKGCNMQK